MQAYQGGHSPRVMHEMKVVQYLEAILELFYQVYNIKELSDDHDEEEDDALPDSINEENLRILDQFVEFGGMELLYSPSLINYLCELISEVKEIHLCIITLLKDFKKALHLCGSSTCGKREGQFGEFKACSKCRAHHYCSRYILTFLINHHVKGMSSRCLANT